MPYISLLKCFLPAKWHTGFGLADTQRASFSPNVKEVQMRNSLRRQREKSFLYLLLLHVRLTSPAPSVRHNWEKHLNIHSIHILIGNVFSAQINCNSSWRVRSCRSNSMLYINISASLTFSSTSNFAWKFTEKPTNFTDRSECRWGNDASK